MLVFSFCFWQAVKYFKCPPPTRPPSLDSLVNPASYSLSRPIIFHSHSHFWIGSSKESPPETNEFMSVHKQSHAHCAQLQLRGPGLDGNMNVFLFIFFLLKVSIEICSCHWNIVLLLVSWQRPGRVPVLSQCETERANGPAGIAQCLCTTESVCRNNAH